MFKKSLAYPKRVFKDFFSFLKNLTTFGILLTGIGIFIFGVVFSMFYLDMRREMKKTADIPFVTVDAYCIKREGLIVLNSFRYPIKNAQIKDLNGKVICSFKNIPSNYEEICKIKTSNVYLLKAQVKNKKIQKVINCEYPEPIRIKGEKKLD